MAEDAKNVAALKAALMGCLAPTGQKLRFNAHETLTALVGVTAKIIYNAADDEGAALRVLLDQYIGRLHEAIRAYPHDERFHDTKGTRHERDRA